MANKTSLSRPPSQLSSARNARQAASTVDADREVVRRYVRAIKIACDEVYECPFDPTARAHLVHMITTGSDAYRTQTQRCRQSMRRRTVPIWRSLAVTLRLGWRTATLRLRILRARRLAVANFHAAIISVAGFGEPMVSSCSRLAA
jgi:hypothetical protein